MKPGAWLRIPFFPDSSLFQQNNTGNSNWMAAPYFTGMPQFWTKWPFLGTLLAFRPLLTEKEYGCSFLQGQELERSVSSISEGKEYFWWPIRFSIEQYVERQILRIDE